MRTLALIAGLLAMPLSAQVAPALWDRCIAVPDPACVLSLTLEEIAAAPAEDHDWPLRRMAELFIATGQTASAAAMVRQIADPAAALYLWPDVLEQRPDPADVALALDLARGQANTYSVALDQAKIARALVRAGALDQARAIIPAIADATPRGMAEAALAEALARGGDVTGAMAVVAAIATPGWQGEATVMVLAARAEAGELDQVLTEAALLPPGAQLMLAPRLIPQARSPALHDTLAALLRNAPAPPDYPESGGTRLGEGLAALPPDMAVAEALRLDPALGTPEVRTSVLIPVLAATRDAGVARATITAAEAITDPFARLSALIDLAPSLDAATRQARIPGWIAQGPTPADRAWLTAELARVTGDAALALQALPLLPAIPDGYDRDNAFETLFATVAAGPEPARVLDLIAGYTPDNDTSLTNAIVDQAGVLAAGREAALALRLARDIRYLEYRRALALARIGADAGDVALLSEAVATARGITTLSQRTTTLIDLALAMLEGPG